MNASSTVFENITAISTIIGYDNPCPRQRNITRPFLFIHNYILLCFGSIFNFLAFAILIQRSLRCQSTFAYLAFLSLSNGLLSLVRFSKWMFNFYFQFAFDHLLITCRLHRFLSDFLTHFSLSTLICVNIDRARTVTTNRPNTKYSISKFRQVLMKECLIACILCAFHFHWFIKFGYEVSTNDFKQSICDMKEKEKDSTYFYLITKIYPPFELVVFFCLPLLINIVCTIIILRSLRIRMQTAKKFHSVRSQSKNSSKNFIDYFLPKKASQTMIYSCFGCQIRCRKHTRLRLQLSRNKRNLTQYDEEYRCSSSIISNDNSKKCPDVLNKKHRTRRNRDIHLSAMLIGLNILYLLLNLPFNLHQTFQKRFHNPNADFCSIAFISLLLDALQQTFFAINFFLYTLTNRRFREELYNNISPILSHCKQNRTEHRPSRPRLSSWNLSTVAIQSNHLIDNNIVTIPTLWNHQDSLGSDLEIMEINSNQQSINDNKRFLSKLVVFKEEIDE